MGTLPGVIGLEETFAISLILVKIAKVWSREKTESKPFAKVYSREIRGAKIDNFLILSYLGRNRKKGSSSARESFFL